MMGLTSGESLTSHKAGTGYCRVCRKGDTAFASSRRGTSAIATGSLMLDVF